MSGSVREMLLGWKCAFVGKRRKKVWQTAHSCLFWTVWKARNRIAFKDDFLSIQNLKYLFIFFALVGDKVLCREWSFDLSWVY